MDTAYCENCNRVLENVDVFTHVIRNHTVKPLRMELLA